MSRKITTGQPGYQLLVANFSGGGDPSHGRNPVKIRQEFVYQHFPEIPGRDSEFGAGTIAEKTPGVRTKMGTLDYTTPPVPVPAAGGITVVSTDFSAPATLLLSEYTLTSGDDFDVTAGTTYPNEDITNTAPDGLIVIWRTVGAGIGEGTINVPANLPIAPGSVTINWISGAAPYSQSDDGIGGFTGDGNPAGSVITYATGAIDLDTTALPPDGATTILITYSEVITADNIATNIATAISSLPGFAATALVAVITIEGPPGLDGNDLAFEAIYGGAIQNFTLTPLDGSLMDAEPFLGPPDIS